MARKKVGTLIKEARLAADMTQEQLARKVTGASASDISLVERGKKDLTQAQLKQIAKATGVTQASLLNAPKNTTSSSSSSSSAKKTTATKKKGASSSSKTTVKVTVGEKKFLELYRAADTQTKKDAIKVLKGEEDVSDSFIDDILEIAQQIFGEE